MSDQTCDCHGSAAARITEHCTLAAHWLDERPVTKAPLPEAVASGLGRFFGEESVETLGDFVAAVRNTTGGGSIGVDDLCHVADETPHHATVEGETYRFRCFFDGIALAHLVDTAVEIRTETPTGEVVTMQAFPDGDVSATPSGAAMSFGVTGGKSVPAGSIRQSVYEAVCPAVKAFSDRAEYERWAESVNAATVGMPLAPGIPVAAALISG